MNGLRLQKILSQAGFASRRAAEKLIAEGRVTVNGTTIREMGTKADPSVDDVRVDGRRVKSAERHRYILLNKPAGFVTTRSDPQRRGTVIDLLGGVREYVYPVGRLDYDTEGLILLTNDGELAARLTHPRHGVPRTYEARVSGIPDEDAMQRLRDGIPLDGRRTMTADVLLLNRGPRRSAGGREPEGLLLITIREGRNRQVRRMCEAVGHPVRKLKRTKFGPISDRYLAPGQWRELSTTEVHTLQTLADEPPVQTRSPRRATARPAQAGPASPPPRRTPAGAGKPPGKASRPSRPTATPGKQAGRGGQSPKPRQRPRTRSR